MEERIPYQTTQLHPSLELLPVPLRILAMSCSHPVDDDNRYIQAR